MLRLHDEAARLRAPHIHISHSVSKLGKDIPSISMPPLTTCRPNAPCARKCYARRGRFAFPHNQDLLRRNLAIWRTDPERFEWELFTAAYFANFFRYFSSGDIPDPAFLAMMDRVAKRLPTTRFLCFTKKIELVNQYISDAEDLPAENLILVFSAWGDFVP